LFGPFLEIAMPMRITIPLWRGIPISLKNERNSYSLRNEMGFPKKPIIIIIIFCKPKNKGPRKEIVFNFLYIVNKINPSRTSWINIFKQ
jgi:hypothetical protein